MAPQDKQLEADVRYRQCPAEEWQMNETNRCNGGMMPRLTYFFLGAFFSSSAAFLALMTRNLCNLLWALAFRRVW